LNFFAGFSSFKNPKSLGFFEPRHDDDDNDDDDIESGIEIIHNLTPVCQTGVIII